MKRRSWVIKLSSLALVMTLLLTSLVGCSPNSGDSPLPEKTDKLVVYTDVNKYDTLEWALYYFRLENPDVEVDFRQFENSSAGIEEYRTTLTRELSAGAGPDLILFSEGLEFSDLHKTAMSGSFQNLNRYIEDDPDFDLSGYNSAALELVTSEEALSSNAAVSQLPENMMEMYQQTNDYCAAYPNDEKSFTNLFFGFFYLRMMKQPLVDYETKQVNAVNNEEFRAMMEAWKAQFQQEENNGSSLWEYYLFDPALEVGDSLLYMSEYSLFMFLSNYGGLLIEQTPVYATFPFDGKPVANLDMAAAINRNSPNKANAYALLKVMLSDDLQERILYYDFGVPVKSSALSEKFRQTCLRFSSFTYNETNLKNGLMSDETIEELEKTVADISGIGHIATPILDFVYTEMGPYLKSEVDYETCVKKLESKLELYINE